MRGNYNKHTKTKQTKHKQYTNIQNYIHMRKHNNKNIHKNTRNIRKHIKKTNKYTKQQKTHT